MGFPSKGCESLYRNSLTDVLRFFQVEHNNNVKVDIFLNKVYNLCIEKDRIYDKNIFQGISVGLFPSKDHDPCTVKYLLSNEG